MALEKVSSQLESPSNVSIQLNFHCFGQTQWEWKKKIFLKSIVYKSFKIAAFLPQTKSNNCSNFNSLKSHFFWSHRITFHSTVKAAILYYSIKCRKSRIKQMQAIVNINWKQYITCMNAFWMYFFSLLSLMPLANENEQKLWKIQFGETNYRFLLNEKNRFKTSSKKILRALNRINCRLLLWLPYGSL